MLPARVRRTVAGEIAGRDRLPHVEAREDGLDRAEQDVRDGEVGRRKRSVERVEDGGVERRRR